MSLKNLTDQQLHLNTQSLVKQEREMLTQILAHLAEIQKRRLFTEFKCSSLFDYAVKILGYSEGAAHRRISAMRLILEVPEVKSKIENGELNLSNVSNAQKFFRQESKVGRKEFTKDVKKEILAQLENKSSREGEKTLFQMSETPVKTNEKTRQVTCEWTEIKFFADQELMDKIEKIKGLLASRNPHLSHAELLHRICDIAIVKLEPKAPSQKDLEKYSLPAVENNKLLNPKESALGKAKKVPQKRKTIPQSVRRIVWSRDKGCCTKCGSRYGLEYDHIIPASMNGDSSPGNLRLVCKQCNVRAAIKVLGQRKMDPYINQQLSNRLTQNL